LRLVKGKENTVHQNSAYLLGITCFSVELYNFFLSFLALLVVASLFGCLFSKIESGKFNLSEYILFDLARHPRVVKLSLSNTKFFKRNDYFEEVE